MKTFSISGTLPVNVIVRARNKKEAVEQAREAVELTYESAGDIKFEDVSSIVEVKG